MEEQEVKKEYETITCPDCEGLGILNNNVCPRCKGMGIGFFVDDKFLYFSHKLSNGIIGLNKFRKKVYRFLDIITYIFGCFGFLAFLWWVGNVLINQTGMASDLFFWKEQSIWLFIFWISLLVDMFMIYRTSQKADARKKIVKSTYLNKGEKISLPKNWEELKGYHKAVNTLNGASEEMLTILEKSYALANKFNHGKISSVHILATLIIDDNETGHAFSRLNTDMEKLIKKVNNQLNRIEKVKSEITFSNEVKEMFLKAYALAYKDGRKQVKPIDLLVPAQQVNKDLEDILYDVDVDLDKLNNIVAWFKINDKMVENYETYVKAARFKPSNTMDRAYTALATPILDSLSYDLTLAAKYGRLELCVARDEEVNDMFEALESGQTASILVGPPGVGKDTIIGGVAQLMVTENVPQMLRDKRLIELDISRLIGGASPAKAQERMLTVIDEVIRAGNVILYIKDIENITGISSGEGESLDLSEILVNALERNNMYCFATTTSQSYTKHIENTSLGRVMTKVEVLEPETNKAIQIIESRVGSFESKYRVYFSYNALAQAVKLSSKYMHDRFLPDKAIDILKRTAVEISKTKEGSSVVTKDDVTKVVSEMTKIPLTNVGEKEGKDLLNLEEKIHKRMIGQEVAVKMVSASLRRARVELREGKRPIANFLFLGPTGVGKTELAKSVAEIYFGNEEYMIRIDMSEYQHQDSVKKMIGTPDGNLGFLTEAVRKAPFSLILLDEIEKAHGNIMNLFLQVMDDGRLTDGQGRTIDFTNSIIIATSNIGSLYIQEQIKKNVELESIRQDIINDHLSQKMRPELINRFDGIVVFKPLTMDNVTAIARLMLNKIRKALEKKGVQLSATDIGVRKLAELGYQPEFGARPLRRLLQDRIENQIANKFLAGEIDRRDTVLINDEANVEIQKAREL